MPRIRNAFDSHSICRRVLLFFLLAGFSLSSAVAQNRPIKPVEVEAACGAATPLPEPGAEAATRCYEVKNVGGRNSCSAGIVCDYGEGTFDGSGPIARGETRKYCCPAENDGRPVVAITVECPRSTAKTCEFEYGPVENPACFEAGGECGPTVGCINSGGENLGKKDCTGEHATCCKKKG